MNSDPLISVASLHALIYCERLYYLEEVERIRVADVAVYAGRRLHEELQRPQDEDGSWDRPILESEKLGIQGVVDVLRRRDGVLIPYEHKRGRSAGKAGAREAWETDRVQVGAYALLVEETFGQPIHEARVRYHADQVTVRVSIGDELRSQVMASITRARKLRTHVDRPPVTTNENLCRRCSLAPVCLPEEARLAADPTFRPIRLLPAHQDRQTLHVDDPRARVTRGGEQLVLKLASETRQIPIEEVGAVVLHGFSQITTQALRLCASHDIAVHWVTTTGGLVGSIAPTASVAQRHIRQFRALLSEELQLALAKRLVYAKISGQLRFMLRATRGATRVPEIQNAVAFLRIALRQINQVLSRQELLGHEGSAASAYFGALDNLLGGELDARLRWSNRSRRPPQDRLNTLLSYGYGMLYREVVAALLSVGLHPGFGFYHQPRSSAYTLALDLMELFRVPIVDMAIIAALNRNTFDAEADFQELPGQIRLTDSGRRKAIEVIERRKLDTWHHSVVDYSLSYARLIELEVRLLEKEWMGEGGVFAKFRLR